MKKHCILTKAIQYELINPTLDFLTAWLTMRTRRTFSLKFSWVMTMLLFVSLLTQEGFTQQLRVGEYTANQFIDNELTAVTCYSYYITGSDILVLQIDGTDKNGCLMLSLKERAKLDGFMAKFINWSRISDSAQISADKLIGTLSCSISFTFGQKTCMSLPSDVSVYFRSLLSSNGKFEKELRIEIPTLKDFRNEFMESESRLVFIKENDINDFIRCFSEISIQDFLDKSKQDTKKQDELFK